MIFRNAKRYFGIVVTLVLCGINLVAAATRAVEPGQSAAGLPLEGPLQPFLGEPQIHMQQVFSDNRFPTVVVATDGSVLAFWNGVKVRRSEDGGRTWSAEIPVGQGFMGGGVTVDENTGTILVFVESGHPPAAISIYRSTDHGKTWQAQEFVIHPDRDGHVPSMHMNEHGITLRHGPHRGRLLRPARWYAGKNESGRWPQHYTNAIYSDDGGGTWDTSDPFPANGTGEATLAELADGRIYYNSRRHWAPEGENPRRRWTAWSEDGGLTWKDLSICQVLPDGDQDRDYGLMGGLTRLPVRGRDVLIFSNIESESGRHHGTVWGSFDGGHSWPIKRLVHEGKFAYSSLHAGRPGTPGAGWIYLLFEGGPRGGGTLARFNLTWLLQGETTGDGDLPGWLPKTASDSGTVLHLDGTWDILFDPANQGREAGWHTDNNFSDHTGIRSIQVPSCWEETEKDYEGVAFYRRRFKVPPDWNDKVVRLQFDAVNFRSEVWLNGTAVGVHEGGFTLFEFRVDDLLMSDEENTLILRVAGPILLQDRTVDGMGPMETPQWRGAITGGIWQSVRLRASRDTYVKDVFIEPKIAEESVNFHLELMHTGEENASTQLDIVVRSYPLDRVVAKLSRALELKPGTNSECYTLPLRDAVYWSPENPHLYRAEVRVADDGQVSDQWQARFGMREFTIRDKTFYLNGQPLFLKATFFEGLYPVKLAYPDSRAMAIREIQMAKEAGFNMIRPWRKPPPPMWLDLADEMGVLTVGSLAIECMDLPMESASLPGWVENEVRESILRDRNRACVVQWELFNELKRPVLKRLLQPMALLARQLDPTRLILDESGGWAQGANMFLPYASEPTKFNDIHDYPGPQINKDVYDKLLLTGSKTHAEMREMGLQGRLPGRNVIPGLMTFFSELGYGSLPDLEDNNRRFAEIGNPIVPPTIYHRRLADQHRQALQESGFDSIYPELRMFCLDQQRIHGAANRRMMEAVRCNPNVAGYCIHALTAGDWIMGAGLLDLFRNPKTYAYEGTQAANQPRILAIRVLPRNVYAQHGTRIEITGVNEKAMLQGRLKIDVVDGDGAVVFTKVVTTEVDSGISQLAAIKLDTTALRGTYTVTASIVANDGTPITENRCCFDVFAPDQLALPERRIAVLDPSHTLKPFLRRAGIAFADFDAKTPTSLPVFVSRTEAKTKEQRNLFDTLAAFIKTGGTAVYLQGAGSQAPWAKAGRGASLLPVRVRIKAAIGLWFCIPHLVNDHPIFAGLPVNGMMGSIYENVWAPHTLLDVGGETIVGAIGFDFSPDFELSKRHYYGPGDTWWGSDMALVPYGRGRCILSQLRLVENLGKDPVAEKIFYNLIAFTTGR